MPRLHISKKVVLTWVIACSLLVSCGEDGVGPDGGGNSTPDAISVAGNDQDVERGDQVTLDGRDSSDPDGASLTYQWRQIHGPDVTDGAGFLTGATPTFAAPRDVTTVLFELSVDDGNGAAPSLDTVQINVMENPAEAIFVDGDGGNDAAGSGSRGNPYSTITGAINRINGPNQNIYVMTRANGASYDETGATISPPTTTSLYGGFDEGWVRDVTANRTKVDGASEGIRMGTANTNSWLSGFELTIASSTTLGEDLVGVRATAGTAALHIEDNSIFVGNAGQGDENSAAGGVFGVLLASVAHVEVHRNEITTGAGGSGGRGSKGNDGNTAVSAGGNGSNPGRGSKGVGGVSTIDGGAGGRGGSGLIPQDGAAGSGGEGPGGNGGNGDPVGAGRVGDGFGGGGGGGGNGGPELSGEAGWAPADSSRSRTAQPETRLGTEAAVGAAVEEPAELGWTVVGVVVAAAAAKGATAGQEEKAVGPPSDWYCSKSRWRW